MARDFAELEGWLSGLLTQLSAPSRTRLAKKIAERLRQNNQRRIAAQQSPEGTAFPPRLRQKHGRVRRAMFVKLKASRWLKATSTADAALVEFVGQAERIARVHHYGLRDRVRPGGPEHKYPERPLLGISESDLAEIETVVMAHIRI